MENEEEERDYKSEFKMKNRPSIKLESNEWGPICKINFREEKDHSILSMIGKTDHQILNPRVLYLHKIKPQQNDPEIEQNVQNNNNSGIFF